MSNDEGRIIEGFRFESNEEYILAKKEWETICNIEKKLPLGDAKMALQVYNKAVSKGTFKTVIGYSFLAKLRETIISCDLVSDEMLNAIPVSLKYKQGKNSKISNSTDSDIAGEAGHTGEADSAQSSKYKMLYENETRHKKVYKIVIGALILVVIAMFAITLCSKYSYLTYFTNYEQNIRDEIVDEYEEWEASLNEREQALNN